jgi:hypothetical protein
MRGDQGSNRAGDPIKEKTQMKKEEETLRRKGDEMNNNKNDTNKED